MAVVEGEAKVIEGRGNIANTNFLFIFEGGGDWNDLK